MDELNKYKNWCDALLIENQDLREENDSLRNELNRHKSNNYTFVRRVKNKLKRILHIGG